MMPYREGPPAAGLPFPRKNIALFTGLAIALSAMVLLLPLPFFATRRGLELFREGGLGMFALVAASLFVAGACGLVGAFAVRGHPRATAILAALPVVPAVLGALFAMLAWRRVASAVANVEPTHLPRILAAGLGETDALPVYGFFVSAIACGAAATALLGGAASVDRNQHHAPAGAAWAGPLVLGFIAFLVAVVVRFAFRTGGASLLLSLPSLTIITVLACLAALNAPLVRHWREPREADTWVASMLAAALLAGAGFALLDLAAAFLAESTGLSAISGEGLDPSQRAAILAAMAEEHHAYRVLAVVDGSLGFVVVLVASLGGLARGTDGRLRFPRGAALYVALGAVALLGIVTIGARASQLSTIGRLAGDEAAAKNEPGKDEGTSPAAFELPRVPKSPRLLSTSHPGAVLRVDAEGHPKLRPAPSYERSNVLTVEADRHASWGEVSKAIRGVLSGSQADLGAQTITAIDLRVTLLDKADRSLLGPYAPLLGAETSSLHIAIPTGSKALAQQDDDEEDDLRALRHVSGPTLVRPRAHEIMDAVAASLAMRPTRFPSSSSPDVALMPPDGAW